MSVSKDISVDEEMKLDTGPGKDPEVCGTCRYYGPEKKVLDLTCPAPVMLFGDVVGACAHKPTKWKKGAWRTPLVWPDRPGCRYYVHAEIRGDR